MNKTINYPDFINSMTRRVSIAMATMLVIVLAVIGTIVLTNQHPPINHIAQPISATDKAIAKDKKQLLASPDYATLRITLCRDYLQKVRETADSSFFSKCDELLAKPAQTDPNNDSVIATQASVLYGRHDFITGLELANKALVINPNKPDYYGLVGDGQIELGQYDAAVASFQVMVNKRPSLSSYNRVAYIREIYGDIDGAKSALNNAIASGSSFPENIAYSQAELGKLYMRSDLNAAAEKYQEALNTLKDYPPAFEGLGKIAFAQGNFKKAINYFNQAFNILPLAQYAIDLGDTYSVSGNKVKADQQYFLADLAFQKSASGGVNNDFEKAVYLNDHSKDIRMAQALSTKALSDRPNIFSADTLAWNLYKQGKYQDAQSYIDQAMRLGETEPVVVYHAGMIANKMGLKEQARSYLQKAFASDRYFLESHFSLLDKIQGTEVLKTLE